MKSFANLSKMELFCVANTLAESVEYWLEKKCNATPADSALIDRLLQAMYVIQERVQD